MEFRMLGKKGELKSNVCFFGGGSEILWFLRGCL